MTNKSLIAGLAFAATAAVLWSMPAAAQTVVYSNLGPGNSYRPETGAVVTGASTSPHGLYEIANAFTPSGNFRLTQIEVGLTHCTIAANCSLLDGTPPPANAVTLMLDTSSDGLPGTPLEEWKLTDMPLFESANNVVQTVKPVAPLRLDIGTQYWVVATPTVSDAYNVWNAASCAPSFTCPPTPLAYNRGQGWSPNSAAGHQPGAFAVFGTPVGASAPEPATLGLIVLGLLGGAGFAGRKCRN